MEIRHIRTPIHGRYLVVKRDDGPWIAGFHGYGETAEKHLEEVQKIERAAAWNLVAIQALHPFYMSRGSEIGASWMTRMDRELAIAENVDYISAVLQSLGSPPVVFLGFSQGVAMAYRAAAAYEKCIGVIVHGSDIPPDLHEVHNPLPPTLVGRGASDDWYTSEKFKSDLSFLEGRGTVVEAIEYDGGHVWSDAFRERASQFLDRLRAS